MSSEIRRLEITYTTTATDRQRAQGIPEIQQLTHDEIGEELADALNEALDQWYTERGHLYLDCKPENFA
jgi:hypothetical protein